MDLIALGAGPGGLAPVSQRRRPALIFAALNNLCSCFYALARLCLSFFRILFARVLFSQAGAGLTVGGRIGDLDRTRLLVADHLEADRLARREGADGPPQGRPVFHPSAMDRLDHVP